MSARQKQGVPIVFRVREKWLRYRLEKYIIDESARVGWNINAQDVACRAIEEFLDVEDAKKRKGSKP